MFSFALDDPYLLTAFAKPLYDRKDTMHDWSHIRRCVLSVQKIIEENNVTCDSVLLSGGLILHGVIYENETGDKLRRHLSEKAADAKIIEKMIHVARDSQKESRPETLEGGIAHDAHLLEGDQGFLITKILVTGTARGQNLDQTVRYFYDHVIKLKPTFFFESSENEYALRLNAAENFFGRLKEWV